MANDLTGITPAHAGNTCCPTQKRNREPSRKWDHPRTRGEYKTQSRLIKSIRGSPPHTRGIPAGAGIQTVRRGITPAHAGNTVHPPCLTCLTWGSPPHTRGIRGGRKACSLLCGITPAHAGNTLRRALRIAQSRDHPRTRGEYTKRIPETQDFLYFGSYISFNFT